MSSIFSTQNRQTFLRRKYAFFCVATALSPPVGRCPALPGLPLNSGMFSLRLLWRRRGRFFWCLIGQAGHSWRGGAFAHHLLRDRGLRRGRRGDGFAMRPFIALLLALFEALQRLVDAHGQKLDDQIRDAQTALEFLDRFGSRAEL